MSIQGSDKGRANFVVRDSVCSFNKTICSIKISSVKFSDKDHNLKNCIFIEKFKFQCFIFERWESFYLSYWGKQKAHGKFFLNKVKQEVGIGKFLKKFINQQAVNHWVSEEQKHM